MDQHFIKLKEVAVLEKLSYKGLHSKVTRNPENFILQHAPNPNGGYDLIYIALSSLTYSAQRAYKAAHPEQFPVEPSPMERAYIKENARPWYVDADFNVFFHQHEQEFYAALETIDTIQEFMEYTGPDRKGKALETAARLGLERAAFYKKVNELKEARAWDNKITQETGQSRPYFQQMAMCRKPQAKNKFPSMTEPMKTLAKCIWWNPDLTCNLPDIPLAYEIFVEKAEELGLEDIPGCATFKRYIEHVTEHEGGRQAHDLAENGIKEFRRNTMIKSRSDTKPLKALECVQTDGHKFDLFVEVTGRNGKKMAVRPTLIAFIDVKTKMILGETFCIESNAQVIKQAVCKMVYGTPGGVPQYMRMDNGKDFTAAKNTGQSRRERTCNLDGEINGFYKSMGIEAWTRALPYQGWSKAQIERLFKTVINRFSKQFKSYVGTLTGGQTKSKRRKDIQGMLERGELLTLEQFAAKWEKWKNRYYNNHQHRGLKDAGEEYTTPLSLWEHCEHYEKAAPPQEMARMLMMEAVARKVRAGNIQHNKQWFRHYKLAEYNGKWVNIRWDVEDESKIYCFDQETGEMICEVDAAEYMSHVPGVSGQALTDHMRDQKRQEKEARAKLKEFTDPAALIEITGKPTPNVVGNFMIGNAPEKKVVAFPQDKEYRALKAKKQTGWEVEGTELARLNTIFDEALAK